MYSGCIIEDPPIQLSPVAAYMSSNPALAANRDRLGAEKCIDGQIENPENFRDPNFSLCHTNTEKAPWLAIDYGTNVTVEEVVLYNREDCCPERTRNVEIWLADNIPTSGSERFFGGALVGTFAGPATSGERIVIQSQPGWEEKSGRYLIVQINQGGQGTILNLREVVASGNPCSIKEVSSRSAETTTTTLTPTTTTTTTAIPGTAHGCLFRDKRDVFGKNLLMGRKFGPSGEKVDGTKIKVKTPDDCAKACSLEEECDAFAFSSFQSNPTKDCRLVKDGGVVKDPGCPGPPEERCGGQTMSGFCPKKQGKKTDGQEDDAYEFVNPDEADFVCETLCKLVDGCSSSKFQIAINRNNCKLLFEKATNSSGETEN